MISLRAHLDTSLTRPVIPSLFIHSPVPSLYIHVRTCCPLSQFDILFPTFTIILWYPFVIWPPIPTLITPHLLPLLHHRIFTGNKDWDPKDCRQLSPSVVSGWWLRVNRGQNSPIGECGVSWVTDTTEMLFYTQSFNGQFKVESVPGSITTFQISKWDVSRVTDTILYAWDAQQCDIIQSGSLWRGVGKFKCNEI